MAHGGQILITGNLYKAIRKDRNIKHVEFEPVGKHQFDDHGIYSSSFLFYSIYIYHSNIYICPIQIQR